MYKKCIVVMLPTNEKSPIFLYNLNGIESGVSYLAFTLDRKMYPSYKPQHLYILSENNRIKKGDWVHQTVAKKIIQAPFDIMQDIEVYDDRFLSIIATTDSSIGIGSTILDELKPDYKRIKGFFPTPSQSFIEKYVGEYNKGNVITEVLVEYVHESEIVRMYDMAYPTLKVNPKDNTITIKKTKDSWTRDEVIIHITEVLKTLGPWNHLVPYDNSNSQRLLKEYIETNL